jgi:hypothetical protein
LNCIYCSDNLDKSEEENLKKLWLYLIDRICYENNLQSENVVDSIYGLELFLAFGCDNPDVILLRYLRARKWNLINALDQLIETLTWRNKFGVNQLIYQGESDLNLEEIQLGKTFYMGHDREGRPISYVSIKDHVKGQFSSESTEKLTVLSMEIGRKLLKYPNESVTVVFDLNGFSMKNMDYQHTKFLINLLQNYYPESLGLALIINAPWLFNGCWFIIKPWLDPVVENKIHFINNYEHLNKYIDADNLPKRFNGNLTDFNYIPPTQQDQIILQTFRQDHHGKTKATQNHLEASKSYLRCTLDWANGNANQHLVEQRQMLTKQLRDSYEQLIPYISTKTHYHRIGYIDEPVFDITYQNIETNKSN